VVLFLILGWEAVESVYRTLPYQSGQNIYERRGSLNSSQGRSGDKPLREKPIGAQRLEPFGAAGWPGWLCSCTRGTGPPRLGVWFGRWKLGLTKMKSMFLCCCKFWASVQSIAIICHLYPFVFFKVLRCDDQICAGATIVSILMRWYNYCISMI